MTEIYYEVYFNFVLEAHMVIFVPVLGEKSSRNSQQTIADKLTSVIFMRYMEDNKYDEIIIIILQIRSHP